MNNHSTIGKETRNERENEGISFTSQNVNQVEPIMKEPSEIDNNIDLSNVQTSTTSPTTSIDNPNQKLRATQDNEERMKAIIQGLSIAAFVIDGDHRVLYWNKALESLTNIRAEDIIGTTDQWKAFYAQKRPCMADVIIKGGLAEVERWYAGRYKKSSLIDESYEATDFFPSLGTNGKWLRFCATVIRNTNWDLIGVMETLEDVSEEKKAEIALQDSEKKYRLIFNYASDGIALLDLTGKIIDVNDTAVQIIGGRKEELIGKHFKDLSLLSIKDIPELLKHFTLIILGKSNAINISIRNRNGELKHLDTSASVLIQNGEKIGVLAVIRDVTKRNQIEMELRESEERFRLTISSITDILYEWDYKTGSMKWFGDIDSKLGYEKGAFSRTIKDFIMHIHPDDVANVQTSATNGLKAHQKWEGEYRVINKNGKQLYWHGTGVGIYDYNGNPTKVVGAITDITERKKSIEDLRKSEEKYRLVTNNATDVIWTMDMNLHFTYVSPSNKKLTGYSSEDFIALSLDQLLTPESLEHVLQVFTTQTELEMGGEKDINRFALLELNEKKADGSIFPIEICVSFLRDENQNPVGILGITRDITERKKQEAALKKSEEKFIKAFRSSPVAICITRVSDGRFLEVNTALEKLIGYTREEILSQTTLGLGIWVDISEREHLFKDLAKDGSVYNREYRFRSKKGNVMYTHYSGEIIDFSGEKSVLSVLIDVTEQKRAIDLLKKSEEKFGKAFNSSPIAICINRLCDGNFIEVNETFLKLSGYSHDELLEKSTIELNLWYNDDNRKQVGDQLKKTGSIRNQEYRFRIKNGKIIIVRYSAELIDFSGERCVLSVIIDITEQKKIEESLQESEEKYRKIVENTQDVIMLTAPNGLITYISPSCSNVLGYPPQDLIDKDPQIFHPDDIEKVHISFSKALQGFPGTNLEYRIITKNGKTKWVSHSWSPIFSNDNKLVNVVSIVRNITESKVAEQTLKEKIEELEKYKNVTINREIKMVDLKNEINELRKQLNQKPKYPNV